MSLDIFEHVFFFVENGNSSSFGCQFWTRHPWNVRPTHHIWFLTRVGPGILSCIPLGYTFMGILYLSCILSCMYIIMYIIPL